MPNRNQYDLPKRTSKAVSVSLPPAELAQAERLAKQTNRSLSGLLREGLKRLHAEQCAARSVGAGEYTPAQRRIIDREIAKGLQEIKEGRMHGPFSSAKDASAYIEQLARQRANN